MVKISASTVEEYLNELPADRRAPIVVLREVILNSLPRGYEEAMNWGMITYQVPLARYPKTYNGQPLMYAGIASQKSYISLYLNGVYQSEDERRRLEQGLAGAEKQLDMGKSCLRFKRLEDIPLELIRRSVASMPVD